MMGWWPLGRFQLLSLLLWLPAFSYGQEIIFPQGYTTPSRPTVSQFMDQLQQEKMDKAMGGPAANYISRQQMLEIIQDIENDNSVPINHPYKTVTKMITIDRQDPQACRNVVGSLMDQGLRHKGGHNLDQICRHTHPSDRYVSLYVSFPYNDAFRVEARQDMIRELKDTWVADMNTHPLQQQFRAGLVMGAGMMAVLFALPTDVTHWDPEKTKKPFKAWRDNVSVGAVMDKDDPFFNYIAHPYVGAAYYMQARTTGHTMGQSFGFAVFMSTIFWEYGFEAFAEKPSIQDLFITPIVGSLIGELFYKGYRAIENNNDMVLNSKLLGKVFKFFLNPMGEIAKKINKLLGKKIIQEARTYPGIGYTKDPMTGRVHTYPGVFFEMRW